MDAKKLMIDTWRGLKLGNLFLAISRNHGIIDNAILEKESFMSWMKTDIRNLNQFNYINGALNSTGSFLSMDSGGLDVIPIFIYQNKNLMP